MLGHIDRQKAMLSGHEKHPGEARPGEWEPKQLGVALFEAAEVPIFVKDLNGRYRLVNRHLASLWGRPVSDIVGRTDPELFSPPVARALQESDRRVIQGRQTVRVEERIVISGTERFYLSTKVPLFDVDGRIHAVCGIATDVTEMHHVEAALRESEARFRILADSAPVLIWMSGRQKEGMFFNKTWLEFTGRTLEEQLGDRWLESVHPDDSPVLLECTEAFQARRSFRVRFRMQRYDGEYRWLLDTGVPRHAPDGSFAGFIGSCVDITEQMHLEEALRTHAERLAEMHQRKDEFLATLGHELRNPLAPVRNTLSLLMAREDELPPDLRRNVSIADRQMVHITRLVDELLDVARISKGHIELKRTPVPLVRVVDSARDAVRPQFSTRNVRLSVVRPEEGPIVEGDETRLIQVVTNLLHNAAKFSFPGGEVTVEVKAHPEEAELSVSDDGIGVEPHELGNLFELFYRADTTSQAGLGLGLALVRKLVDLHGGRVTCWSEGLGKGSTFKIVLPRVHGSELPTPPWQIGRHGPSLTVLVVDDNVDAATTLAQLLEAMGHDVRVVYDGEGAVRQIDAEDFDLVLLDIGLPDRDGCAVARTVRSWQKKQPVLIALSGYGDKAAVARSKESGIDHHVLKPVGVTELRRILEEVAEHKR